MKIVFRNLSFSIGLILTVMFSDSFDLQKFLIFHDFGLKLVLAAPLTNKSSNALAISVGSSVCFPLYLIDEIDVFLHPLSDPTS